MNIGGYEARHVLHGLLIASIRIATNSRCFSGRTVRTLTSVSMSLPFSMIDIRLVLSSNKGGLGQAYKRFQVNRSTYRDRRLNCETKGANKPWQSLVDD